MYSDDEDMEADAFDVEKEELRRLVLSMTYRIYAHLSTVFDSMRLAKKEDELALEEERRHEEEKRRLAGELAIALRTVGIKVDHPLRKKLDKFLPAEER